MVKNRKFRQKSKFGQKSKVSSKIESFVKNRNFGQKTNSNPKKLESNFFSSSNVHLQNGDINYDVNEHWTRNEDMTNIHLMAITSLSNAIMSLPEETLGKKKINSRSMRVKFFGKKFIQYSRNFQ